MFATHPPGSPTLPASPLCDKDNKKDKDIDKDNDNKDRDEEDLSALLVSSL